MPERARVVAAGRVVIFVASALVVVSCAALVDLHEVPYVEREVSPPNDVASDGTASAKPDGSVDSGTCSVQGDGMLHCANRAGSPLRAEARQSAPIVNTLRTASSYFECWSAGELHAGGNTTWYYTIGDDNPSHGWIPAVLLYSPDSFDANPSAFGLRNCRP